MKSNTVTKGSVDEEAAIERFKDFYAVFTPENVLARVRDVYAKDAYLTDALRELNGIEDIEAYMLRLLKAVESCTFEFLDVAVSGGEYYFRWVSEAKPPEPWTADWAERRSSDIHFVFSYCQGLRFNQHSVV